MLVTRWQAPIVPDKNQIKALIEAEGFEPFEETLEANSKFDDHRHPFDEVRIVVSGEVLINVAGNKLLLRGGDKIVIPSNTKHSMLVEADMPCLCICAKKLY